MSLIPIRGNMLGIALFVLAAIPALILGFVFKLSDAASMIGVGLFLLVADLLIRAASRSKKGWLFQRELGGYLFFVPVWVLGIIVVIINVVSGRR
ncbi:MAG: hypothetical protein KIH69_018270 [Anaerolineae bacterium]|nr:hypothetical protein [Anaerolineae bacterium]